MKKFLYCILPFIIIWGGYFSLLCIPQLHHEYLGTVESNDVVIVTSECQSGNDHYDLYTCKFKYKDVIGVTRSSDDIHTNVTLSYIPSRGFVTRSNKSWEIKQLIKHGKVYAPGWTPWVVLTLVIVGMFLVLYFCIECIEHFDCYSHGYNYACGKGSNCFGCPFCVTDKQAINDLKIKLNKPKEVIKKFFKWFRNNFIKFWGYENNS